MDTVTVFAAGFLVDLAYVRWLKNVAADRKLTAALASMAVGGCGLVGLTGVVADAWLAIPYLLGLGAGTAVGMVRQ